MFGVDKLMAFLQNLFIIWSPNFCITRLVLSLYIRFLPKIIIFKAVKLNFFAFSRFMFIISI